MNDYFEDGGYQTRKYHPTSTHTRRTDTHKTLRERVWGAGASVRRRPIAATLAGAIWRDLISVTTQAHLRPPLVAVVAHYV